MQYEPPPLGRCEICGQPAFRVITTVELGGKILTRRHCLQHDEVAERRRRIVEQLRGLAWDLEHLD